MSSSVLTSESPVGQERQLMSSKGWIWTGLIALGFVALFFNFVYHMASIALGQFGGDWSHALVIPFISLYYVYLKRGVLMATPARMCWWGLPIFLVGLFSYAWWIAPGRNDMLQGYSMILALFGLVLLLLGPRMMGTLWFPIAFLGFAVKVSPRYWDQLAVQLQGLAAKSSMMLLNVLGVDAMLEQNQGSTIVLYRGVERLGALNVAEACAGLRMLMAFLALGVAMAFLFDRAWWQRLIMVVLTIPIAVGINVGRVTVTGLLYLVNKDLSAGDFHIFVGMLMLLPALLVFMLLGWILDHIIVKDDNDPPSSRPPMPPSPSDQPVDWKWIAKAMTAGAVLIVILGAMYGLAWAAVKPAVFEHKLSRPVATVLLGVAIVGLGCWAFYLWRLNRAANTEPRFRAGRGFFPQALTFGILFASVFGLYGVLKANDVVLIRKSVAPREPLYHVPDQIGGWKKIKDNPPLSHEMVQELGTTQYISRIYSNEASGVEHPIQLQLHVAYYTGTPDTVPHVPERCYTAGGMTPLNIDRSNRVKLVYAGFQKEADGQWVGVRHKAPVHIPASEFNTTIFTFASPSMAQRASNVLYFFAANGKFYSNPDQVRFQGFDPRDEYSYYCKIEVNLSDVADSRDATKRAEEFLSLAVPEIMACLPDWNDVLAGKYPVKAP